MKNRISVSEVAELMNVSEQFIRIGLQKGIFPFGYVLLRKQTCKDMKKKMVKIRKKVESGNMMNYSEWCSINSYKGWTDYGNCFRLTQKYVEPLIPYATKYYELNVKKGGKVA